MIWVRKGFVHLLSLLLLVSLLGAAGATSYKMALAKPDKLEVWLKQSKLYDNFAANIADQAQKATSQLNQSASSSDPIILQAAQTVFSPQLLQSYASTFINSNYAWLQGKTIAPNFTIDLTPAKQDFAKRVGQYVKSHVADLQPCTNAQLAQIPNVQAANPLTIPCLPNTLDPKTIGSQITQQLNGSNGFLSTPVFTARTLNSKGNNNQGEPYYKKLSVAPKLYKWGQRLPLILGGLAILSTLGIVFIAPTRRRGIRRIGIVMLAAGVVLVAVKFVADTAFNHLEKRIFNNSSIGQLQQSLTDVLHRLETQLVKVELWFGVAFLVVAVLVLVVLWLTRNKSAKPDSKSKVQKPDKAKPSGTPSGTPSSGNRPPLPVFKQPPRPPKRPRLIQ